MPIYEYRCQNDHRFEVLQKFADEALTECEVCGAPARRVLHPVAIHFKGPGFYTTDYGRGKKTAGASKSEGSSSSGDGAKSDSGSSSGSKDGKSDGSSGTSKKAAEA